MGRTLKLTAKETLEVITSTPELFEIEVTYSPSSNPPPAHFHPSQDEHFEILSGAMTTVVDDEQRVVGAGETIDIPRGTVHKMWNDGAEPAKVRWQTRPALRTEQWFESIDALYSGPLDENGMPDLSGFLPLLEEYDDVFRLHIPES